MTTIAYDGKHLAADSMASSNGYLISKKETKIVELKEGKYKAAAFAGEIRCFNKMIDWLQSDMDEDNYPACEGTCIAITKAGEMHVYGPDLPADEYGKEGTKMAFGSGGDLAMGAMAAGCSAEEAVHAAIEVDLLSGGQVHVIKCGGTHDDAEERTNAEEA